MKTFYLLILSLHFIFSQELIENKTGFIVWVAKEHHYGVKVKIDYDFEYALFLDKAFIKQKAKAKIIGDNFYKNKLIYPKKENDAIHWNSIQINAISFELELYDGINHLETVQIQNVQSEAISFPVNWGDVFGLEAEDEKELFEKGFTIKSVKIISIEFSGEENLKNAFSIDKEKVDLPKVRPNIAVKNEEISRNVINADYTQEKKDRSIQFSKKEKKEKIETKAFYEDWEFFKHNKTNINPYYKFSYSHINDFSLLSIAVNYNYYFTSANVNHSRPYSVGLDLSLNYLKALGKENENLEGSGFGLALNFKAPLPRFQKKYFVEIGVGIKDIDDQDFNDYKEIYVGLFTNQFSFGDIGLSLFKSENSYDYVYYYESGNQNRLFDQAGLRLHFIL